MFGFFLPAGTIRYWEAWLYLAVLFVPLCFAVVYLLRGGIDAYVAAPMAIGVFSGAFVGSRIAGRIDLRLLRLLFVVVQAWVALQMALRALGVS